MILVTSAAGHSGSAMVKGLVDRGFDVIATDVDPRVKDLPGIKKAMVGDLTDIDFQRQLIDSCDQIVYVPPLFSAEEELIGKSLIDLAVKAKLKQFVFISVIHPILTTLLQHVDKRNVEEHLLYTAMNEDLPYTILQPTHYMHGFTPQKVMETGVYKMFYPVNEKRVTWVDEVDVAEVLAKVVADPQKYNKADLELVGTERLTINECVETFNELTGKHAKAVYQPIDELLDEMGAKDLYFREGFRHLSSTYTKWGLDGNTMVLEWQLGRKPTTFKQYLQRKLNL